MPHSISGGRSSWKYSIFTAQTHLMVLNHDNCVITYIVIKLIFYERTKLNEVDSHFIWDAGISKKTTTLHVPDSKKKLANMKRDC